MFERQKILNKLGHPDGKGMSDTDLAILRNVLADISRHHDTPFIKWSSQEIKDYLEYLRDMRVSYENLQDGERWALEEMYVREHCTDEKKRKRK